METSFSSRHSQNSQAAYDFRRCKYCGSWSAAPHYRLGRRSIYACSRCDFHAVDVLDPPPSAESPALTERSRRYMEERMQEVDPLLPLRLDLVRRYLSLQGVRCLDIGAGTGQFMRRIIDEGARARGLEPSALRREFARLRFGLELQQETVEAYSRLPHCAGSFDMATLWDVIEHVNFPVETLEGAMRTLKPGGLLFIDTPSRDALAYRLSDWTYRRSGGRLPLYLETFYPGVPYGHKQIFRPRQLEGLAQRIGFEVLRLRGDFSDPSNRLICAARPRKRIVLVCRRPAS